VDDDVSAVSKQKHDQVPGLDGIRMEAFIFACRQLGLYLNILFNLCLKYGYVPDVFNRLVRCKTSDLADVSNYIAIALSNAVSMTLETHLFCFVESLQVADEYEFGFKKNHSPALCTDAFKKTVD
jgi:hypothetical protein